MSQIWVKAFVKIPCKESLRARFALVNLSERIGTGCIGNYLPMQPVRYIIHALLYLFPTIYCLLPIKNVPFAH